MRAHYIGKELIAHHNRVFHAALDQSERALEPTGERFHRLSHDRNVELACNRKYVFMEVIAQDAGFDAFLLHVRKPCSDLKWHFIVIASTKRVIEIEQYVREVQAQKVPFRIDRCDRRKLLFRRE